MVAPRLDPTRQGSVRYPSTHRRATSSLHRPTAIRAFGVVRMTTSAPDLVSLVSAWSHKPGLFSCDYAGETRKTNETRFSTALKRVKKSCLSATSGDKHRFTSLRRIAWSHWSYGLTLIINKVLGRQRDQLRPKHPSLRPKSSVEGLA